MKQKQCPMKFEKLVKKCEGSKCAWWSTYHNCCAVEAIAQALQGLKEGFMKNLGQLD